MLTRGSYSFLGAIVTLAFGTLSVLHRENLTNRHIIGESWGRKKTLIIGVIVMSIGAVGQTVAYTVGQMILARVITGQEASSLCVKIWLTFYNRDWKRVCC
jgi:MFS family permease